MIRGFLVATLLALATPALAEVTPKPGPGDPHLQTVGYDPEQVVALRVAPGFALTVQLSPDERVETISVGNSSAWQVQPNKRGDVVFIKLASGGSATNLTIFTDVRRYSFTLYPTTSDDQQLAYTLRFTYPVAERVPQSKVTIEPTRYRLRGDKSLWPLAMSDDGSFTSIAWAPDVAIPAVYLVDARGRQALVNGVVRDGAYVIEGVARQMVFKLGKARATATRMLTQVERP